MDHFELTSLKHEKGMAEMLPESAVVRPIAVTGIPDNGMTQVSEVPAQLMAPTGQRTQFDQTVAGGRVGPDGERKLKRLQGMDLRLRRQGRPSPILLQRPQGRLEMDRLKHPATDKGKVGFPYAASREKCGRRLVCLPGKGKEQDPGSRTV